MTTRQFVAIILIQAEALTVLPAITFAPLMQMSIAKRQCFQFYESSFDLICSLKRISETPGSPQARAGESQLYVHFYCVLKPNTLALINAYTYYKFLYYNETEGQEKKKDESQNNLTAKNKIQSTLLNNTFNFLNVRLQFTITQTYSQLESKINI